MSETTEPQNPSDQISREEMHSALFAHLVMQQSNMAMLLLGKVPHPETGKTTQDFEAAKLFIDQLEMIELKTKGNLSNDGTATAFLPFSNSIAFDPDRT